MILILSHPDDIHVRHVTPFLSAAGQSFEILDLSQFPHAARLTMDYGPSGLGLFWTAAAQRIDLGRVRAAWWRRPQPFQFEAGLQSADFARSECDEVFAGPFQPAGSTRLCRIWLPAAKAGSWRWRRIWGWLHPGRC